MADKQKFTSKSVYVVLVLVVICLVCTLLLAFAKDLFAVSDQVKFDRSMSKIYPGFEKKADVEVVADPDLPSFGEVKSVVAAKDGGYVVEEKLFVLDSDGNVIKVIDDMNEVINGY